MQGLVLSNDVIIKRVIIFFSLCRYLPQCFHFSMPLEKMNTSAVIGLLQRSRPAAIAWLVVSVIVDSVYQVLWGWTFPHVGKELFKIVPCRAHPNATSTPQMKLALIRVATSFSNAGPYSVFLCVRQAVRSFAREIFFPTATGFCFSRKKVAFVNAFYNPTRASTKPFLLPARTVPRCIEYRPPVNLFAHVHMIHHNVQGV